eukprot:gene773-958_t
MDWLTSKLGGTFKSVFNEPPKENTDNNIDNNNIDNKDNNQQQQQQDKIYIEDDIDKCLSNGAIEMIKEAMAPYINTPSGCIVDHLINLFGIGTDTNCFANSEIKDLLHHPIKCLKFKTFSAACAIDNQQRWDHQYVERFVYLTKQLRLNNFPFGKHVLSAIDKRYDYGGRPLDELTGIYVPNDYLIDIINDYKDYFIPCISIHPYRKDAVEELVKWSAKGVRFVRWLPVSMGINLSSELCDQFYEALVENDMILFVHTGVEHSLIEPPECDSKWGNPLLLQRPLNLGVKIVAVHCGGEGKGFDLDQKYPHPLVPNVNLFLRLMNQQKYEKNLIGDISGIVAYDRIDSIVSLIDQDSSIHNRLIYGSDYPIPAVNLAVITTILANRHLITPDERDLVNEIYQYNPILFDFVLKRILKSPITGNQFNVSVFKENKFFNINSIEKSGFQISSTGDRPPTLGDDDYINEQPEKKIFNHIGDFEDFRSIPSNNEPEEYTDF